MSNNPEIITKIIKEIGFKPDSIIYNKNKYEAIKYEATSDKILKRVTGVL